MPQFAYFCGHEQFQPEVLLEHAVLAESVGFDALTVSDHFHPWVDDASACGFAWTWLGALAARTRRVRHRHGRDVPPVPLPPGAGRAGGGDGGPAVGGPVRPRRRHRRRASTSGRSASRSRATRSARARMAEAIAIMRRPPRGREARLHRHLLPDREGSALQPARGGGPHLDVGRRPPVRHARRTDRRRADPERQGPGRGARADHRPVSRGGAVRPAAPRRPWWPSAGRSSPPTRTRPGRPSRRGAGSGSRGAWRRSTRPCSGPGPMPWTAGRSSGSTRGRAGRRISSRSIDRSSRSVRTSSRSR